MADGLFSNIYDIKQQEQEDLEKSSLDVARLGGYGPMIHAAGQAGGMLGGGLVGALGGQTQAEAKQAKIQAIQAQFADLDLSDPDNMRKVGNALMADFPDLAMKVFKQAEEAKSSSSEDYLANKRLRNEKALAIQQAFGPTDSIEKKQELKNKLISLGYGDSTVTTSLGSEITTLKAAGFKASKEARIAESEEERLRLAKEKEERIAERQAQDTKYKSVTNFQKGTADANWYFTTNEPEGFSDDEKKALGQKVGSEISDYDNMLSSEATRSSVTPAVAQGYYTKVLDLPNVYTADPEFKFGDTTTWGTDAAFSENNFKEALDTVFNRGGKVVKAQDVAMYSKLDLIIPMITKVTINGKTGVLTPESVAKLRLKYSK